MNKKVLTLCAGLLLAGGVATPAFADTFAQAEEGTLYRVYVNASSAATTTDGLLSSTSSHGWSRDLDASTLWTVKTVKINGSDKGYQLVNAKTGKVLSVKEGTTTFDTFNGDNDQLLFEIGKGYANGYAISGIWYYNLQAAAPIENTVATLNAILGNGFEMQICYQPTKKDGSNTVLDESKAPVAYSNLNGNVFTGVLKAEATDANATSFNLVREDGKYIVLTDSKWGNLGADATVEGSKFAAVAKADLTNPEYKSEFSISNPVLSNGPLEVVVDGKELVVVEVNGSYYLTVATAGIDKKASYTFSENNKHNTYVQFGAGNVVAPKDFVKKAYYTITRKADGKVLGLQKVGADNAKVGFYAASEVQGNMPEGMWTLAYDDMNDTYTFNNRETNVSTSAYNVNSLYKVDPENGVYKLAGDEVIITTTDFDKAEVGYAELKDGKTTKYTAGVYSAIWDATAWMAENHAKSHQIGLVSEEADAAQWTAKGTKVVVNIADYSYFDKNGALQQAKDTLKANVYTLTNEYGENLHFDTNAQAYVAGANTKNFLAKKDGANYNLVEATLGAEVTSYGVKYKEATLGKKVYGGDSAAKGILNRTAMYQVTENDLINIKEVDAPTYHRIANVLDTISIYRDDNSNQLLFEDGKFLGLKNVAQFDIKPAMTAEAAYAPADYYRPEYLLSVGREGSAADTVWCDATTHKHATLKDSLACPHTKVTEAFATGRYLVSLADSAAAFESAGIHGSKNPYVDVDGHARLGFVDATLKGENLIITSAKPTAADTIKINDENMNVAKFAFRYVDPEAKSFVIETADKAGNAQYVKWTNSVIALVNDIKQADVFSMNEDETSAPTANETIATSEVTVAATNGAVVVKGAAGKAVVVTNILGQTLANTVITSDNATIAVPAGVAVVAVEGEAAVKVVVK